MITVLLFLAVQCTDGAPPPCSRAAARPGVQPTSVAVLYFDNASRDTNDAYLADGITEEIISRLGEVGRVQVKSRQLVRRYRGDAVDNPASIGRQLAVASIVTGSVRRAGNRVRVTAEMVRTATGDVVWSERYDRGSDDVLSLQADLAGAVATAITGRLLPAESRALAAQPTRSREAWDHFLRGNFLLAQRTGPTHGRAVAEYEAALRLDPGFHRAQARVAYAYGLASWRSERINDLWPDSSNRLARIAAERAVRANPRSSDAWLALGVAQLARPESLASAHRSLERAIALDSTNADAFHTIAWVPAFRGRYEESLGFFHQALALDPNRPVTLVMMSAVQVRMGHHADALRSLDSSLVLDRSFLDGFGYRARLRFFLGDTAGARADMAAVRGLTGMALWDTLATAFANLAAGDSAGLRAWAAEEQRAVEAGPRANNLRIARLALAWAWLGERDRAVATLELSQWRSNQYYFNIHEPPLDRLRGMPGFDRLVEEYRLLEAGAGRGDR